jgi:hypothetical protein
MDFKINKEVTQVANIIENGTKLRRLLWGAIATAALFGTSSLITALHNVFK